jgi:hypothetical protein
MTDAGVRGKERKKKKKRMRQETKKERDVTRTYQKR